MSLYSSTQRADVNGRKEKTTSLNQQQPLAGLFPWPAIVHTVETVPIIWSQKQCHSWKCPLYFYCSINYGFIPLFDFVCFRESHGNQIDFMPPGRVTNNNMKIALFIVWIIALLCRVYSVFKWIYYCFHRWQALPLFHVSFSLSSLFWFCIMKRVDTKGR